jgi:hypothetical protein
MFRTRFALLPLALLICGFVSPERFEDAGSGLAAVPPEGFTLLDLGAYSEQSSAIASVGIYPQGTTDLADPPTPFCVLTLHARPDLAARSQDELNALMRDPATIEPMQAHFAPIEDAPISMQGKNGHWFVMAGAKGVTSARDRVQAVSLFDTPSGRVTISCQTLQADMETDRATLDRIREGVTLP